MSDMDSGARDILSLSEQLQRTKMEVEQALKTSQSHEHHHLRVLDTLATVAQVKKWSRFKKMKDANKVSCAFDVVEAFWSAMGLGDDINGMVRTCPPPRPPRSEYACQVDSGVLIFWLGNLASKLASAVSNCEDTLSVGGGWGGVNPGNDRGPLCAAGVGQMAGALGELAGASSMAATACANVTDPDGDDFLDDERVSVFGDQTQGANFLGRQLLIGEGEVGNGIQCAVDVGMVTTNIANMGLAINSAVNSGNCQHQALPKRRALCTVDVGRAVSFFAQIVTFIQFSIVNCENLMNASALCGAGISGIGAAAASMAPGVASIVAGCKPPPPLRGTQTSTTQTATSTTMSVTSTLTSATSTTFTSSSTRSWTSTSVSTSSSSSASSTVSSISSTSTSLSSTATTSSSITTSSTTISSTSTSTETSTSSSFTSSSSLTTTATTTSATNTTTTFTQQPFDCLSGSLKPLQMLNRPDPVTGQYSGCPDGSDIKVLDINTGTYTPLCRFENQCFNACGMSPTTNFIYCIEKEGNNLMRLDCSGGTACYVGKIGSSYSANFNPITGDFVMTNQKEIVTVPNVDGLVCSSTPLTTNIPGRTVVDLGRTDLNLADMMVTNISGLPGSGEWMVSCSDKNTVYLQNLQDKTLNYNLQMVGFPPGVGILGPSGAQWQWRDDLYCAYNNQNPPSQPGGVWDLNLASIDIVNGTIEVANVSASERTSSNDGMNCLGGDSPFPPMF